MSKIKTLILVTLISITILTPIYSMATIPVIVNQNKNEATIIGQQAIDLGSGYKVSINFTREIRVSKYIYTSLNDTMVIKNLDDKPFSSVVLFYSKAFFNMLSNIWIVDYKGRKLNFEIAFDINNFIGLRIYLREAMVKDAKYSFSLRATINDAVQILESEDNILYNLTIPDLYAKTLNNITTAITYFYYPEDAQISEFLSKMKPQEGYTHESSQKRIKWERKSIKPINLENDTFEEIIVPFKRSEPLVRFISVERDIHIKSIGKISVTDKFYIQVLSPIESSVGKNVPIKLKSIKYAIYEGIFNVNARDNFGKLSVETEKGLGDKENWTYVNVLFRTELFGIESYYFEVSFDIALNNSKVLWENESGIYFRLPIAPVINASFAVFRCQIVTPYVFVILNPAAVESFSYESYYKLSYLGLYSYQVHVYSMSNMIPEHNIVVQYRILPSPWPLIWMFMAFFAIFFVFLELSVLLISRLGERAKKVELEEIPELKKVAEELEKYIKRLEEYIVMEESIYDFIFSKLSQKPSIRLLEQLKQMLNKLKVMENRVKTKNPILIAEPEIAIIIDKIIDSQTNIELARTRMLRNIQHFLRGSLSKKRMIEENEYYLRAIKEKLREIRRQINKLKDLLITKYQV